MGDQGHRRIERMLFIRFVVVAAFFIFLVFCLHASSESRPIKRVLILHEAGINYPAMGLINDGIRETLKNSPYQIEFYGEYFETALFPDPHDQATFKEALLRRYRGRHLDLIITVGSS